MYYMPFLNLIHGYFVPSGVTCVNSMEVSYIPIAKARGFTTHWINFLQPAHFSFQTKDMWWIYQDPPPHSSLRQSYNPYFDLISEITWSASLNIPCSLDFSNFASISFSVIGEYGFDSICLFISKGSSSITFLYIF